MSHNVDLNRTPFGAMQERVYHVRQRWSIEAGDRRPTGVTRTATALHSS